MANLQELLDDVRVEYPEDLSNAHPDGMYAVSTDKEGVIAYFGNETDAFRFRLDKINRILNP